MNLPTTDEGRESSVDRRLRIMREALDTIADRPCECHPDKQCAPCIAVQAIKKIDP